MAKTIYKWKKYSLKPDGFFFQWGSQGSSYQYEKGVSGYTAFKFDEQTGVLSLSGSFSSSTALGERRYSLNGSSTIIEYVVSSYLGGSPLSPMIQERMGQSKRRMIKDALLEEVFSFNRSDYPDNGINGSHYYEYIGTTVDNTPPVITVSGITEGAVYQSSVNPTFSAIDAGGSGLEKTTATLNGVSFTSGTPITTSGNKTLVITAVDKVGNQSQKTINFSINTAPILSLTTLNNQILTEGNTFTIAGNATDVDNGNVVTIKYKIKNGTERALHSALSNGNSPISFTKGLSYRGGRLYDGSTDVSGLLAEDTTHTLSVWAVDDQGGTSATVVRSFTVKHNKAPILTVNTFTAVQSGLIPPDTITLSGTASDPDGNTITVKGKLNTGAEKTLLSGLTSGNWSFAFKVSELISGTNTLAITATDQFGSSTIKSFSINNSVVESPLKKSVARYKIVPPLGSAKEILAWLKHEKGDLVVDGEASFVDVGQPEQYVAMSKNSIDLSTEITEDELLASVPTAKANLTFKLTFSRTNTSSPQAGTMMVGVIE
ncbi:hypothetical protein [uncultured Brevibacillus sp.]|uniref:hypothetical protein n=1 Tax=uncultured Brevibacillus sp. TaxID=169970 RepID=UPI0025915F3E|nr:hypothetical protein [uncultured Brevibacillus sp.]